MRCHGPSHRTAPKPALLPAAQAAARCHRPRFGAAGERRSTPPEKQRPQRNHSCLGRGLELSPLQQIKNKKPKSFSPQLRSGGRGTFSKALHARRESEAHVHKPRLTAGCENEANNPHHAPAAEATATRSLHSWAIDSSFERKGTGRYQSLILSQQRRLYTNLRGQSSCGGNPEAQGGSAAGSCPRPPADPPLKMSCLRVNPIPVRRGAGAAVLQRAQE